MMKSTWYLLVWFIFCSQCNIIHARTWILETIDQFTYNPHIAIDSTGKPHISYFFNDSMNTELRYAVKNGQEWIISVVDTGDKSCGQHSSIAVDSIGQIHISYSSYNTPTGGTHELRYARKDSSWHKEVIVSGGGPMDIEVDSLDVPHIVYSNLKHATRDGSFWWTETITNGGNYPSLALDSEDIPHVSYYQNKLYYAVYKPKLWEWSIQIVDANQCAGQSNSIAIDSNDNPHIAYYDAYGLNMDLKYASFDGSSWSIEIVDSNGNVGQSVSLALDSDDDPHISYKDETNNVLKYAYYDGASWHTEIVDGRGDDTGTSTSIALDFADRAHIAYLDSANVQLRYARLSYAPEPECLVPLKGDLNNNCKVDFTDFALFTADWLSCNLDPQEACW